MIKSQSKKVFNNCTNHISINKSQCDLERLEYNAEIQNPTAVYIHSCVRYSYMHMRNVQSL